MYSQCARHVGTNYSRTSKLQTHWDQTQYVHCVHKREYSLWPWCVYDLDSIHWDMQLELHNDHNWFAVVAQQKMAR